MLGWLLKNSPKLTYDIHSHLLPGLDDGVKTFEESLEILRFFESKGYQKVITTPHIYKDVYPNSEKTILDRFAVLTEKVKQAGINLKIEVAAEYFIDEFFQRKITEGEHLLTWEGNHVLMETSFYNKPGNFDSIIFDLKSSGYIPVLAHPERYHYLEDNLDWLREQVGKGVLFQVNIPSMIGVYGKTPKRIAARLLKESLVSFLGSDIHRSSQIPVLSKALNRKFPYSEVKNRAK